MRKKLEDRSILGSARDLTGVKFGRWLAIEFHGRNERMEKLWLCRCECGSQKIVRAGHLTQGRATSCGCASVELTKVRNRTHGQSKEAVYQVWNSMITRCDNPNNDAFKNYGARGIRVCNRWAFGENGVSGFECFIQDMGSRPDGLTVDRIDNDGDYEPGNCQWDTRGNQAQKTRRTVYVKYEGDVMCLAEYARRNPQIKRGTLYSRKKFGRSLGGAVLV